MRQKIDVKEKTAAFNSCRQENLKKTFFFEDLKSVLKKSGVPSTICELLNKYNSFDKKVIDGRTIYSFKNEPLYVSVMDKAYSEKRGQAKASYEKRKVGNKPTTSLITQQQAWDTLVEAGIIKAKFNLSTLKAKYPKVYLDCLEYELNPERK